jgi:hypothetical protein
MNEEIIEFAKEEPRTVGEIMVKFGIKESQRQTFRRRLKEAGIKMKESRGRKKINFQQKTSKVKS